MKDPNQRKAKFKKPDPQPNAEPPIPEGPPPKKLPNEPAVDKAPKRRLNKKNYPEPRATK